MMKHRGAGSLAALTLLVGAGGVRAQERAQQVTTVAGPEYAAGSFQRLFLGDNWRDVWTTPVRVPVLDLASFAGGLEPERQGGGNQSRTLHMLDAKGEGWVFRSIDKFPEQGLPPELGGSPMGALIGDQISALLPASSLILPGLLDAAGILHLEPKLYLMPDDPRLGEHRTTFAGMLGGLEFKPNEGEDDSPGWAGSRKIQDSDDFLADLESSPDYRVDAREYLAARLIDFLVGDTDRGTDQWRWARFGPEGDYVYRPIPRDRDWAFVRADGLLLPLSRPLYPKTTAFGDEVPSIATLTFSSHILDRRLLTSLTRADFAAAASNIEALLTDAVIADAVSGLPPEYEVRIGAALRAHMAARLEALPAIAQRFYDWLATDVDVRATDARDRADIERRADGTVVVRLSRLGTGVAERNGDGEGAATYFERTFLPAETGEVRVHLHGEADHALITGAYAGPIVVRVIGGDGDDRIEDRTGSARLYDQSGDNTFATAAGTSVNTRPWEPPDAPEGFRAGGEWAPDWGGEHSLFSPSFDYGEGAGVIVGVGPSFTRYGFRRLPYRWTAQAQALYAIGDGSFGAGVDADYRFENSPRSLTLSARAVQFDAFRFYGFGNDTPDLDGAVTLVMQDRVLLHAGLAWHIGPRPGQPTGMEPDSAAEEAAEQAAEEDEAADEARASELNGTISIGPILQWTRSKLPEGNPLRATAARARIASGQVGARAAFALQRTDRDGAPRRGFRLEAEASAYPAAWDAGGAFGTATAQGTGYLPLIGATHVAVRFGGAGAFGEYPAFESAFIGGRHSLRGFRSERFAGDAAVFGGAELRVPLGTVPLLVRGELGVFGLADAARVWHGGESPGGWHTGVGGGLWFTAFGRAVSVAYARGESGRLYAWAGLPF